MALTPLHGSLNEAGQENGTIDVIMAVVAGTIVLGEEVPLIGMVCKTVVKVRSVVDTTRSNRQELAALTARCERLTGDVVTKWVEEKSSPFDLDALLKCLKDVKRLAEQCSYRGCMSWAIRCAHTNDIAGQIKSLNDRISDIVADYTLAGVTQIVRNNSLQRVSAPNTALRPRVRLKHVLSGVSLLRRQEYTKSCEH